VDTQSPVARTVKAHWVWHRAGWVHYRSYALFEGGLRCV